VAQPVTFGHHLMAWFEMLKRDDERLVDCRRRINRMPLGAAALAGTSYPLDRVYTAELLEFEQIAGNSMDAVSDRDFIIEFSAAASIIMMHLSRYSEELILWINPMFGFIDIDDAYCTGSSIMPQKKNPDIPELVRGKTARVYGDLMAMLTLMKAQPLAYNRDNQEDKIALFDVVDTLHACIGIYSEMIPAISVNRQAMMYAASKGHATATDLADYLVKGGMAFRDAHEAVGKTVSYAIDKGKGLSELTLDELGQFCPGMSDNIYQILELNGSINARNIIGGTAPAQVRNAIKQGREYLKNDK
jgi:argininosuccinate lyase